MANDTHRVPMPNALLDKHYSVFTALWNDEDAICAIVGTSYLEHALRSLLRSHLVDGSTTQTMLDPTKGALGQLHNAACAAYCLGLISKGCKANIELIGQIRNLFAHSMDGVSFENEKIAELCSKLTLTDGASYFPCDAEAYSTPKRRFSRVVFIISTVLLVDALVEKHREARKDVVGN